MITRKAPTGITALTTRGQRDDASSTNITVSRRRDTPLCTPSSNLLDDFGQGYPTLRPFPGHPLKMRVLG